MKTPALLIPLALLASTVAFASHPHDRICVGTAQSSQNDPIAFSFQWELGRTYQHGDPNEDSHELVVQARACWDDNDPSSCLKITPVSIILEPKAKLDKIALKLVSDHGVVLFDGTFDAGKEILTGKFASDLSGGGPRADAVSQLACVSQPFVTLVTE